MKGWVLERRGGSWSGGVCPEGVCVSWRYEHGWQYMEWKEAKRAEAVAEKAAAKAKRVPTLCTH